MSSRSSRALRGRLATLALAAFVAAAPALAGPYGDFERGLAAAYAPYRAALFQSNQNDKAGTQKSLAAFEAAWGKLMGTYRSAPPPQYVEDAGWAGTVGSIDKIIADAKAVLGQGNVPKAHEVLEAVRDKLGDLRARNGVIMLSDRIDAYHEHMEHVLATKRDPADGTQRLIEDAAVLVHLATQIERFAPAGLKSNAEFKDGAAAVKKTAVDLQDAARKGDQLAIEKAIKGLKPAYAKLFVKFG